MTAALALGLAGSPAARSSLTLVEAPTNLGLKPLRPGHIPGAGKGPAALRAAGLDTAVEAARVVSLGAPAYRAEAEPDSRIRNASGIRAFSLYLAATVSAELAAGRFPLVVGGDCSILLGCLLAARPAGAGLVHVDGHSDFYHPGNYDVNARLGSVAGMDLALATGRGEALLADWDGRPLIEDRHVVQIGERDELEPDYDYWDVNDTEIRRLPVRSVLAAGVDETVRLALAPQGGEVRPLWLHVDLDVLDQTVMPAVDSPGSPGLDYAALGALLSGLLRSRRVMGMNVTIYDPDLDPDGVHAAGIVACLGAALAARP